MVDVGGFLGLFARSVRVDLDQLDIERDLESDDVGVDFDLSQEELENLPVHDQQGPASKPNDTRAPR